MSSGKKVTFRFDGGADDGKVVSANLGRPATTDQEAMASGFYAMTYRGEVGRACEGLCDADVKIMRTEGVDPAIARGHVFKKHRYRVSDRRETDSEITITMKHELTE
jgi:hypothetical protein